MVEHPFLWSWRWIHSSPKYPTRTHRGILFEGYTSPTWIIPTREYKELWHLMDRMEDAKRKGGLTHTHTHIHTIHKGNTDSLDTHFELSKTCKHANPYIHFPTDTLLRAAFGLCPISAMQEYPIDDSKRNKLPLSVHPNMLNDTAVGARTCRANTFQMLFTKNKFCSALSSIDVIQDQSKIKVKSLDEKQHHEIRTVHPLLTLYDLSYVCDARHIGETNKEVVVDHTNTKVEHDGACRWVNPYYVRGDNVCVVKGMMGDIWASGVSGHDGDLEYISGSPVVKGMMSDVETSEVFGYDKDLAHISSSPAYSTVCPALQWFQVAKFDKQIGFVNVTDKCTRFIWANLVESDKLFCSVNVTKGSEKPTCSVDGVMASEALGHGHDLKHITGFPANSTVCSALQWFEMAEFDEQICVVNVTGKCARFIWANLVESDKLVCPVNVTKESEKPSVDGVMASEALGHSGDLRHITGFPANSTVCSALQWFEMAEFDEQICFVNVTGKCARFIWANLVELDKLVCPVNVTKESEKPSVDGVMASEALGHSGDLRHITGFPANSAVCSALRWFEMAEFDKQICVVNVTGKCTRLIWANVVESDKLFCSVNVIRTSAVCSVLQWFETVEFDKQICLINATDICTRFIWANSVESGELVCPVNVAKGSEKPSVDSIMASEALGHGGDLGHLTGFPANSSVCPALQWFEMAELDEQFCVVNVTGKCPRFIWASVVQSGKLVCPVNVTKASEKSSVNGVKASRKMGHSAHLEHISGSQKNSTVCSALQWFEFPRFDKQICSVNVTGKCRRFVWATSVESDKLVCLINLTKASEKQSFDGVRPSRVLGHDNHLEHILGSQKNSTVCSALHWFDFAQFDKQICSVNVTGKCRRFVWASSVELDKLVCPINLTKASEKQSFDRVRPSRVLGHDNHLEHISGSPANYTVCSALQWFEMAEFDEQICFANVTGKCTRFIWADSVELGKSVCSLNVIETNEKPSTDGVRAFGVFLHGADLKHITGSPPANPVVCPALQWFKMAEFDEQICVVNVTGKCTRFIWANLVELDELVCPMNVTWTSEKPSFNGVIASRVLLGYGGDLEYISGSQKNYAVCPALQWFDFAKFDKQICLSSESLKKYKISKCKKPDFFKFVSSKLQFCPVIFSDMLSRSLPLSNDPCTNPSFFDLIGLEKQICLEVGNKSHTKLELKSVSVKKWTSPVITKRSCARPTLSSYIDKKEQICPVQGTCTMPNLFGLASLKDQDLSKEVCPVLAELTHSTANTGSREKPLLFGVRNLQEEIGLVIAKESCAKPTFCDVVDDIRQVCPVIGKSPFSRIVQETCVTPSLLDLVGLEEFRTLICPVVVRGSCTKPTLFDFLELQDVDAQSCPAIVKGTCAQPTLLNLVNFIQFREPICPVIVKGSCKMPTLNDVLDFKKSRDPTCPIIVKGKCARMTMKKMLGVKNVKYPVCPMIMKRKCKKKTFQKLIGLKKLKTKRLGLKKMRYPVCPMIMKRQCKKKTFQKLISLKKLKTQMLGLKEMTYPVCPMIIKRKCKKKTFQKLIGLKKLKTKRLGLKKMRYPVCPMIIKRKCKKKTFQKLIGFKKSKTLTCPVIVKGKHTKMTLGKLKRCARTTFTKLIDFKKLETSTCPVIVKRRCARKTLKKLVGLRKIKHPVCPLNMKGRCKKKTFHKVIGLKKSKTLTCSVIVKGRCARTTLKKLINLKKVKYPICPMTVRGRCKKKTLQQLIGLKKLKLKKLANKTCSVVRGRCKKTTLKKLISLKKVRPLTCPVSVKGRCRKKTLKNLIQLKKVKDPVCPVVVKGRCRKTTLRKLISLKKLKPQTCPVVVKGRCRKMSLKKLTVFKKLKDPTCPVNVKGRCTRITLRKFKNLKKLKDPVCPVVVKGRCKKPTVLDLIESMESSCPINMKGLGLWPAFVSVVSAKLINSRNAGIPELVLDDKIGRCRKSCKCKLVEHYSFLKIMQSVDYLRQQCLNIKYIDTDHASIPVLGLDGKIGRCSSKGCKCKLVEHYNFLKTMQSIDYLRQQCINTKFVETDHASISELVLKDKIGRCSRKGCKCQMVEHYSFLEIIQPVDHFRQQCINTKFVETAHDNIYELVSDDKIGRCSRKGCKCKLVEHCSFLKTVQSVDHFRQQCINTKFVETDHNSISELVLDGKFGRCSSKGCKCKLVEHYNFLKTMQSIDYLRQQCINTKFVETDHASVSELVLKDKIGRCSRKGCKCQMVEHYSFLEIIQPVDHFRQQCINTKFVETAHDNIYELVSDDKIGRCSRKGCKCKLVEHCSFLKTVQSVDHFRQQCINTKFVETDHNSISELVLDGKFGRCSRKGCKCKLVEYYVFLKTMQSVDHFRQQCINTKFVETDHASISELVLDGKIGRCSRKGCKCKLVEHYSFLKTMQSLDHFRQQCMNTKFVETDHASISELVLKDKIGRCSRKGCKCQMVEHYSFLEIIQPVDHFRQQCINTKFVETAHDNIYELVSDDKIGRCSRKGCKCKLVEHCSFLKTVQSVDHFRQQCINTKFVETDHNSISELVLDGKFGRCSSKGCKCKLVEHYNFLKTMQSIDYLRQQCINTKFVETDHASISELVLKDKIGRCSRKGCKCQMVEHYSFLEIIQPVDHFRQQCINTKFVETAHDNIYELVSDDKIGRCSRKGCKCKLVEHCSFLKTVQSVDHFRQQCINTKFVETDHNSISELVLDGKFGRCSMKGCKCQMVEYYSFLKTMQSLDHFRQQCMNTEFVETDHNGIYESDDKIGRCSRKGCKCKLVEHCSFLKTVQSVDHFKQQCINTKFVETTQNTNTNQVTLSHITSVPIQTKRTLGDLPEPPKIMSKTPLPARKQTLTPIGGTPDSPTIMVKAPKPTLYQTQSPLGDVLESPRIMTKAPITTESPPIMSKAPEPKLSVTLLPPIKKKQGLCPNVYERLAFPARMLTSPAVDNFLVQLPADESDKEEDKDHLKNGTGPPKLQGGDDLIGPTPRCLYPAQ